MTTSNQMAERTRDRDAMIECQRKAESRVARSWRALEDGDCSEGLKEATAAIGWSIELMCMVLQMDYQPFRSWLDNLVGRIPPEAVDCVFAERYYKMARELFFAAKEVAGID
jgi:hypothetical protein